MESSNTATRYYGIEMSACRDLSDDNRNKPSLVEEWFKRLGGKEFPKDTDQRVENYFKEMKVKRDYKKFTAFETKLDEMIIINKIKIFSFCEHHLLPFFGHCSIGYVPTEHILGLSKFQRLVDSVSTKPTLQEDVTEAIANKVESLLKPRGLGVTMNCQHSCMFGRGIERPEIFVSSQVLRGAFKANPSMRSEFLHRVSE